MVILIGCHRCKAVSELKVEGGYNWTEENIRMQQIVRRDREEIEPAEAINGVRCLKRLNI